MGASQSAKIPKDLKNAKVQVALQKTCYQSGEVVTGNFILQPPTFSDSFFVIKLYLTSVICLFQDMLIL
jgi:hypothetical protein